MENLITEITSFIESNLHWILGTIIPTIVAVGIQIHSFLKNVNVERYIQSASSKLKSVSDLTTKVSNVQDRVQSALTQFEYTANVLVENITKKFESKVDDIFNRFKESINNIEKYVSNANYLAEQMLIKSFDKELITSITKQIMDEVYHKILEYSFDIAHEVSHPIVEGDDLKNNLTYEEQIGQPYLKSTSFFEAWCKLYKKDPSTIENQLEYVRLVDSGKINKEELESVLNT